MTDRAKRLGNQPANSEMYFSENGEASDYCPFKVHTNSGLTKREYFAAMAMQGLLSNPERYKYIAQKVASGMTQDEASAKNAHKAVLLADALLEELSKME